MAVLKLPLLIGVFIAGVRKVVSLGVWGVLWTILLVIAWDIITPPYVTDLEGLIAFAAAPVLAGVFGLTVTTAFIIILVCIYALAALIILISFWFF